MSFKDFRNQQREYELSQEKRSALSRLESLFSQASRLQIQQLLGLPDRLRTGQIEDNVNYRVAVRQLIVDRLEVLEVLNERDQEKRTLMQNIVERIEEIERITQEMEVLKMSKGESDPPDDPTPNPGRSSEIRPSAHPGKKVNAA
ncbi:hypothetical protein JXD20_01655 [Candidatus Peregrinibacteria bacterium]|nr:hypothetical protein [Candidatus Peregrinibacteria bacterium]